ncbi:hypothetical protein BH11PLA1_BH11PLA1_15610 [soil metagenome]
MRFEFRARPNQFLKEPLVINSVRMSMVASVLASAGLMAGCKVSDEYYRGVDKSGSVNKSDVRNQDMTRDTGNDEGLQGAGRPMNDKSQRVVAEPDRNMNTDRGMDSGMKTGSNVMYYPTGTRSTSALMLEVSAPAEVISGQEFCYDYKVTNITNMELKDVMLRETLGSAFRMGRAEPAMTGQGADSAWNIGTLSPGASRTTRLCGTPTGDSGMITSCATLTYNSSLCISTNVVKPALAVSITAPAMASACEDVPVRIVLTNSGSGTVRNARVTYAVPAGFTAKNETVYAVNTLAPGASTTATVNLTPSRTGTFASTANATADGNLTAKSETVNTLIKKPVLALTADCPTGITQLGRQMAFKFTVKNTGDYVSNNTMVSVTMPANSRFESADMNGQNVNGVANWNVGALNPGEAKTVGVTLRNMNAGVSTVAANARGDCADAVAANCSATAQGAPDIGTAVTDDDGVVVIGDDHTYRVEVVNQGQVDLTNVKMTVTIPAGMTFVSSPKGTMVGGKVVFDFATLKPGEKRDSTFVVKSSKAGELLVIGETTCNELKTPVRDDELTNFIP